MAQLRYQWGGGELQDDPVPPGAARLILCVGQHPVWEGLVHEEVGAWLRWRALRSLHAWACPEEVRRFLETGEPGTRSPTRDAARRVLRASQQGGDPALRYAAQAVYLATERRPAASSGGVQIPARPIERSQLRRLLLQRVLPEPLWPLIDADEGVLCDALLEGRHR